MKKLFTLAAAVLASISLSWSAEANLTPTEGVNFAEKNYTWPTLTKNQVLYDAETNPQFMAWSNGNNLAFDTSNGMKIGNSSKKSAVVFRIANTSNITINIGRNGSDATVTLYYLGESTNVLTDPNSTTITGTKCDEKNISSSSDKAVLSAESAATGYYEILGSVRFCVKDITIEASTPSTDPVAEVTIDGPILGTKDIKSTFTATTDVKADAYKWFVNDAEQTGATEKTFEFTPNAIGSYNVVCKARNANNATDEWIASSAITLKVYSQVCGEIIRATHTGKTTATVTGLIGGTAEKSTESSGKLNSNGYFGITLASGNFQEGDTLNVHITGANTSAAVLIVYEEKTAENVILNTGVAGAVGDNKFALPATINGKNTLYIVRTEANAWNAVVDYISVIRPIPSKSTAESLTAVSVDDEAISDANLTTLLADHELTLAKSFVDAPVVKFTKHIVTTYEDDSQKESDKVITVTAEEVADVWQAAATINSITYTIKAAKLSSVVVTYMDGETKLGEENVEIGGHPANYANFQNKSLYSFLGWFNNPDLAEEHKVADISAEVINVATTFYAKFEKEYAQSINIEQLVLDHGTSYDVVARMGGIGYASNITNDLDTLNDLENKTNRNYDYLGLKVKKEGKLLNFNLAAGKTVKVKFGNIGTTPQISINGAGYANMEITNNVYTHTAEADELLSIKTVDGKTLVFKQIMIDEDLQEVTLPTPGAYLITVAEVENGTITASWDNKKYRTPVGATVTLTVTPDAGYKTAVIFVNDTRLDIKDIVDGGQISFTMPAEDVTITGEFTVSGFPTALDNTEDNAKAIKTIENGQIVIIKNGVRYNVLGAELR